MSFGRRGTAMLAVLVLCVVSGFETQTTKAQAVPATRAAQTPNPQQVPPARPPASQTAGLPTSEAGQESPNELPVTVGKSLIVSTAQPIERISVGYGDIAEAPPSGMVQHAIEGIVALLEGKPNDLNDVALDLDGVPEFHRGVYDIARTIPPGKTMTYGDIARRLGGVELSRDVGQALGRNPCPIVVPCHRVLAAGGKPGGFSANGGVVTKLKMLAIEGAVVNHTPSLFD